MRRTATVVAVLGGLVVVVLAAHTVVGSRWLEDRVDTFRWFTNEVKTLAPK
jgi:hypothetical protein